MSKKFIKRKISVSVQLLPKILEKVDSLATDVGVSRSEVLSKSVTLSLLKYSKKLRDSLFT